MLNNALQQLNQREMSDKAYEVIRDFIYQEAGIDLGASKHNLVRSRLNRRLKYHRLSCFDLYADLIKDASNSTEREIVVDLLTTNETYFFRESEHLESLKKIVLPQHPKNRLFRVWSAASSSGEEAYSIAMVLDDFFGTNDKWEVFGSDISRQVLEKAQRGLYQAHRIDAIPKKFLHRYCLKGTGEYQGFLLIDEKLRKKVSFSEMNLTRDLRDVGLFDVIFLRNVLIYFDNPTKEKIVRKLASKLRPKGFLYIGHSESLKEMNLPLELIAPTTYQKV